MLAALSLSACRDDDATSVLTPDVPGKEETSKWVDVEVNLSTRAFNGSLTRANENIDPSNQTIDIYGTNNEKINDWFMIFVHADGGDDKKGKIATVVKRSQYGVISDAQKDKPVDREKFNLSLQDGKYHVYTFGNIDYNDFRLALAKHVNSNATEHYVLEKTSDSDPKPTMPDIKDFAWDKFQNQTISSTAKIPLCSVDSDIEVRINASMEIELERIIGKLQFYFANKTKSEIRISNFKFMPVRNKTYMLEHDIKGGMVADDTDSRDTLTKTQINWTVPAPISGNPKNKDFTKCDALGFYLNETVPRATPQYPLGHFKVIFEIERVTNSNGEDVVFKKEKRTSMLHNLAAIERNQWYMQPIMFTDWVLQPEIHYYPPIGGYPVVQVEAESDFEECYSTFQGVTKDSPFQIRLHLHNLHENPDKWYDITDKTIVKNGVIYGGDAREESYFIDVHEADPANPILNHSTLSLNSGQITSPDGQLTGHFTGKTGHAIISVYANIEIDPVNQTTYTYERDLYVIVK